MDTKKILNYLAFVFAVVGVFFKANHWAGAAISIVLAGIIMLITLFVFGIKSNREIGMGNSINYFMVGTLAIFIVGIVFKIQHWPGANILIGSGYILAFCLPILLIASRNDFKVSKQYMITFSIYFILLISLFPKNPLNTYFKGGEGVKLELH